MKLYRIKVEGIIYVSAVVFDEDGLHMIPNWDITSAAIYEEDKAKKYCEMLNERREYKEADIKFELEMVEDGFMDKESR